jgi:glutathione S-transferase
MAPRFVLHHHPHSRSQRIRWLLEEAGAPYEIVAHDFEAGTHKRPDFLKLNPDGKLPTVIDRGPDGRSSVVLTESAAIVIHIPDAIPEAGLAPPPGAPERGPYLTWIVYTAAALEPALADAAFPRATTPPARAIGWPPFEAALDRVQSAIGDGPWLLGERFSAADVMLAGLLFWVRAWGKLPDPDRFGPYLDRIAARPAHRRIFAA